jgi:starch-binding outer membrane protein, SusD/RagB family
MKKLKISAVLLTSVLVFFVSCNTEFLNTKPLDKISSDATWADGALSQAFVFNVYSYLGYGGFEEQALAAYTDEAMFYALRKKHQHIHRRLRKPWKFVLDECNL